MGFLNLFKKKEKYAESVVLIDIGADSVAGAYVRYAENEIPVLLFARRVLIEIREGETHEHAMMHALETLGVDLIREGAPSLLRATGSGSVEMIFVSVDAPWQETILRAEHLERRDPFIFSESIVGNLLENTAVVSEKHCANESIVSTVLNGYETPRPYGEKIHRASITILTSLIDTHIFKSITAMLRGLYHTDRVLFISGRSLRSQAMRAAFPHEHDAIILDAIGPLASIALVRKNIFTAFSEIENSTSDANSWLEKVANEFSELAKQHTLPRVLFLLAHESEISSLQQALALASPTGGFNSLWASNTPPKVVPILAGHIAGSVKQATDAHPDLRLFLSALYYQNAHQSTPEFA